MTRLNLEMFLSGLFWSLSLLTVEIVSLGLKYGFTIYKNSKM